MVIFSEHAERKIILLREVGVSKDNTLKALEKPDQTLYDADTGRFVAINRSLNLIVVYEKPKIDTSEHSASDFFVITVIYSSELEDVIQRRTKSGRWIWIQ